MKYSDSLRYLNSFLNLERITWQPETRLWNLDRMRLLLECFNHPEKSFFSVLIAGTKGKGSTGFFLESILRESGIRVGFYSSPHLEDPRERIRLHGRMVSKKLWTEGMSNIRQILAKKPLNPGQENFTYFEIITLLAMLLFQKQGIRIGIFEVGMGGRLDATNVLDAKISILTPIYLDHEAFLGNTVSKIAREKAAIIRSGADVVVSRQTPEANRVIDEAIKKKKAKCWKVQPVNKIKLGLTGDYQELNAGAACAAARLLKNKYGYPISNKAREKGLRAKGWPGRFEVFPGRPDYLLDGAHNPSSIEALTRELKKHYARRDRLLIFGTSRDKKSDRMLKILGAFFDRIILTRLATPRTKEIAILMRDARKYFRVIFPVSDIPQAIRLSRQIATPRTLVVVTGSFYLIGDVRRMIRRA